jgi:limonene-1,2-epoxide hydrolase
MTTTNIQHFMAYAAAFEQTFVDDDWSRLERFFTDDASYRVSGLPTMEANLQGRDAIFKGIKKSLDGFDRRMASRKIVPTAMPAEASDGTVTFSGYVTYTRAGSPPIDLHATIVARFVDGRIAAMHDTFSLDAAGLTWLGTNARDLDGSYG